MDYVTLLLRAGLALMFATAATGKFMDLRTSRATVEAFGVPRRFARPAGTLLPFAESLCAIALILQPTARISGAFGALLIAVFSGGIAHALRGGATPECNCFGQISSAPISVKLLLRNAVIFAVALFVALAGPGASFSSWTSDATLGATVASVATLGLCAALIALINSTRRRAATAVASDGQFPTAAELARAAADPDSSIGKPAPDFQLLDWDLQPHDLGTMLTRGLPIVVVFAGMECEPCGELIPELARWSQALAGQLIIVVIESAQADPLELHGVVRERGDLYLLCEPGRLVAEAYGAAVTPTGVVIGTDGQIVAGPAPGSGAIEAMIRMTLSQVAQQPAKV